MQRILILLAFMSFTVGLITVTSHTSDGEGHTGHTTVYRFLFEVVIILLAAKVGGELFETWNQPAVLGELVFGVVPGNLHLLGLLALEGFKTDPGLALC